MLPVRAARRLSTLGLYPSKGTSVRPQSTIAQHHASPSAPREVPTPLVLLSASKWSGEPQAESSMSAFVKHFTARGWNVTCVDLDPEGERSVSEAKSSPDVLSKLESELGTQLRQASSQPFPPVLVAKGLASLIAETFVSSNPLSALALLDPPLTPNHAHESHPDKLPTELPAFTYEPRFPCLVAWSPEEVKNLAWWDVHRIEELREEDAGEAMDRFVWDMDNAEEQEKAGPHELRKWAEDSGISGSQLPDKAQSMHLLEDGNDDASLASEELQDAQADAAKVLAKPDWFVQGAYRRNPTKSKKEPLLLDESHLEESFIRGSGPGGQAINKLSTCVQLKHTPTGTVIRCQDTRSRPQNREHARRRMSKELERLVFGERDSVLGLEALRERRRKQTKSRKRRRKEESQGRASA